MYEEDYGPPPLPTIEECQEFLRLVNVGREAIGLDALEYLDYDDATPGSTCNCLSARNLFGLAGYKASVYKVLQNGVDARPEVLYALGMENYVIPQTIKVVTDPFDARGTNPPESQPDPLRDRMVEAGVVRP